MRDAASTGAPTSSAAAAAASARLAARSESPASSATAAAARSAIDAAMRSRRAAAVACALAAARSASLRRPSVSQQRVSSSRHFALQTPGMSGRSSPPDDATEGIGGAPWIAVLEERGGERHPGRADEALVEPTRQLDALLGGGERHPDVAGGERRKRAIAEIPGERLDVARQSCSLDGVVEQLAGFGQLAAQQLDLAENRVRKRDELALARRPTDRYRSFGVSSRLLVAVEVELGAGEVGRGIEPKCELVDRPDPRRARPPPSDVLRPPAWLRSSRLRKRSTATAAAVSGRSPSGRAVLSARSAHSRISS